LYYSYYFICQYISSGCSAGIFNWQGKKTFENKQSNSSNPASNSITDIITIGDTVWVGTGKGVSLSTDRGVTWTNFYNNEIFGTNSISAIAYDKYTGISGQQKPTAVI